MKKWRGPRIRFHRLSPYLYIRSNRTQQPGDHKPSPPQRLIQKFPVYYRWETRRYRLRNRADVCRQRLDLAIWSHSSDNLVLLPKLAGVELLSFGYRHPQRSDGDYSPYPTTAITRLEAGQDHTCSSETNGQNIKRSSPVLRGSVSLARCS